MPEAATAGPVVQKMDLWPVGENVSLRDAFGRTLCHLAQVRDDFVLLDADIHGGTGARLFVERFGDRVFEFGIAEQNMMAAAAGIANAGLIPIVQTFSVFATMRAHEQLRTAVAYGGWNVKVCASHLGVDVGPDGPTAQMLEDLAVTRSIPDLAVVVPADAVELCFALEAIMDRPGAVYMRIGRSPAPVLFDRHHDFAIGKAKALRRGGDVAIIATGALVSRAVDASARLALDGIEATVINMSTIKPIDVETISEAAGRTGAIVTAEDHTVLGGLGGAVAEVVAQNNPVPVEMVGIKDRFGKSGDPSDLAEHFGLTPSGIAEAAWRVMKRKKG